MKKIKGMKSADNKIAALILGPMIFWWLIVCCFPIGFGITLGFLKWNTLNAAPTFNGIKNFIFFFKSEQYVKALWRAVWLGGACTLSTMALSFLVANLMNMKLKGKGVFRTVWYIPAVTSTAAIAQIISLLLMPENGVINRFILSLGAKPLNVELNAAHGVVVIIIYSIWKGVGSGSLLWLAGLQSVDKALYEAADVDGAGYTAKFIHITIPSLSSIALYAFITGAMGAIQIYEQIAFLTGGGPMNQTETSVFLIMRDAFFDYNFGMAGASAVLMALLVALISFPFIRKIFNVDSFGGGKAKRRERA